MPDVGLFTATETVSKKLPVVIRYSVEVGGLPVYTESYDVDKLASELARDESRALRLWERRLKCVVHSRHRPGFSACLTRCLADGQACDLGAAQGEAVDDLGPPQK